MEPSANPFAVLSLIVAPAILTNACSVLIMSTSNRLARAVDRARELAKLLENENEVGLAASERPLQDLAANERRALMLLQALQSFYTALSGFAAAALVSVLGAVLAPMDVRLIVQALELAAVTAGFIAVAALIHGAVILVRETRLAVRVLADRADAIRKRCSGERQASSTLS